MGEYLTMREFAAYIRVGLQTAYRLIWAGSVERINIAPKGSQRPSWRVRREAADKFMSSREKGRLA